MELARLDQCASSGFGSPMLQGGRRPCPSCRTHRGRPTRIRNPRGQSWRAISNRLIYVKMVDMGEDEDQPLGYLLYRVMAGLRPQVNAELRPLGLGLPEFVCLRVLSMSPGRSSAELARDINVSPQAMNMVLRGLQDLDVVTRPASVSSGRALPAELTNKGRTLLKRAEAAVRVAEERTLTQLTVTERQELKRLLAASGSGAIEGPGPSCIAEDVSGGRQ